MSDADMWETMHEESQAKKASNEKNSLAILKAKGIEVKVLNAGSRHYRVGTFDFWPSTGKFYNQKTGQKGRGVFNLIKLLKQK